MTDRTSSQRLTRGGPGVGEVRRFLASIRTLIATLLFGWNYRSLRWILVAGFAVRLLLAPISSWASDTPALVDHARVLSTGGNPYLQNPFNNPLVDPPLGTILVAALYGLLSIAVPTASLLYPVAGHLPLIYETGLVTGFLPIPAALILLKLPSILADGATAVVLYQMVSQLGRKGAGWAAALWFLNPLTIWTSAVAGHFDSVAAMLVITSLLLLVRQNAFTSGLLLGLGTATKLYPALLFPIWLVYLLVAPRPSNPVPKGTVRSLLRFVLGSGAGLLVVVPFFGQLWSLYRQGGSLYQQPYGGLTFLVVFDGYSLQRAGFPPLPFGSPYHYPVFLPLLPPSPELLLLPLVVGLFAASYLTYHRRSLIRGSQAGAVLVVALAATLAISGALLSFVSPQPENVLALLPMLLLALPHARKGASASIAAVSSAGWGIYLYQITPLGSFYPLWSLLGTNTVTSIDAVILPYTYLMGFWSRYTVQLLLGFVGGSGLLIAFFVAGWALTMGQVRREVGG